MELFILNALCRNGSAKDVFKQCLEKCYCHNCYDLSSPLYLRSSKGEALYHPDGRWKMLPHPFVVACESGNLLVVLLFLLLGVTPDSRIGEHHRPPLEIFAGNQELSRLLCANTPFAERGLLKKLATVMDGQLESAFLRGGFSLPLKSMMQWLQITNYRFVYTREFQNLPILTQAMVYRMLMSSQRRNAIARKMEKMGGENGIPPVLRRAMEATSPEFVERMNKFFISADFLPVRTVRQQLHSVFSKEEHFSLLQRMQKEPLSRRFWGMLKKTGGGVRLARNSDDGTIVEFSAFRDPSVPLLHCFP